MLFRIEEDSGVVSFYYKEIIVLVSFRGERILFYMFVSFEFLIKFDIYLLGKECLRYY